MLSDQQFERARGLALSLAGIDLVERHRDLLARRRVRFGMLDDIAFDRLLRSAEAEDPAACQRLLSLVTTKFTGFFRHPCHFQLAAEHAMQAAHRHGLARIWSAAASTGEEPYSMAISLIETFGVANPPATILATDVDETALALASRGEYAEQSLRGLALSRRERFVVRVEGGSAWVIAPEVRQLIEWHTLNLVRADWQLPQDQFDVIFCRNVLMYLESSRRQSVLQRMASMLAADGLLMLDPTEHVGKLQGLFTRIADGVHSLTDRPGQGAKQLKTSVPCALERKI